jgi:hypothetical protein
MSLRTLADLVALEISSAKRLSDETRRRPEPRDLGFSRSGFFAIMDMELKHDARRYGSECDER